jgi:hypothetical protein
MNVFRVFLRALAVLLVFVPALVKANTINYGNKVGTTMVYSNIQETSTSPGDTAPLYGTPIVSGDSLIFNRMTFSSQANNGASDTTSGEMDTDIVSKGGFGQFIDRLRLQELGDTTLAGSGTSATRSSISNSVFVAVLAIDFEVLSSPEIITGSMTTTHGGQWTLPPPITGVNWTGSLTLDISGILESRGYYGHATWVHLTVDNDLDTSSELGTSAYIAKKAEGVSVTAEMIPEPGSLSLLVLGGTLLLIGRFGRKS